MNQEQNSLNQNNLNTQGNNGVPNNQPLNNQNFNQGMSFNQQPINSQPQPTSNFQQPINQMNMQQPTLQPVNNSFENVDFSNQNSNNKPQKKMNIGLIIGIVAVIAVVGIGVVFGSKLISNKNNDNSNLSNGKNNSSVKMGNVKVEVLSSENQINNSGLYKIGDEYIFKGGDLYTKKSEDGSYNKTSKLGNLKNFVKFNNNYWRIIKINSDGTIRLVWAGKYNKIINRVLNDINLDIKYVETKSNNFSYENSYIRNYLNTTFLNDTSIIPSNYNDYLEKFNFDISIYSDSIYDIYSYKNSENVVTKQISSFKDYVGILSINDFYNAKIDSKLPPEGKYDNNFIVDILESTGKSTVLEVNTSNIIVDENNNTIGVAKILRSNGSWFMLTNYNIDINYSNNVIPVITLKSNINFESGDGSIENPYIVK